MPFPRCRNAPHNPVPDVPTTKEQGLIARLLVGDPAAFEEIFRVHYEGLFRFVYSYVGAEDAAKEIVQEAFIALWEHRAAWEERGSIGGYLYNVARNRALNDLRHRKIVQRTVQMVSDAEDLSVPGMGEPPSSMDERLDAATAHAALDRAIRELPDHYRRVLNLRIEHEMSYAAIGEALGIPTRTAETRMTRAIGILRKQLCDLNP